MHHKTIVTNKILIIHLIYEIYLIDILFLLLFLTWFGEFCQSLFVSSVSMSYEYWVCYTTDGFTLNKNGRNDICLHWFTRLVMFLCLSCRLFVIRSSGNGETSTNKDICNAHLNINRMFWPQMWDSSLTVIYMKEGAGFILSFSFLQSWPHNLCKEMYQAQNKENTDVTQRQEIHTLVVNISFIFSS